MRLAMRLLGCFLVSASISAAAQAQQVIEWNYNGQAIASGSGCTAADTHFISAGNEMSVIFSQLGVSLTGVADGARVAKKTCRIIIPTRVRTGYYIGVLQQSLTYGYERTSGTEGTVSAVSEFYNQAAGTLQRAIPTPGLNTWSVPSAQAAASSTWRVLPNWCLRSDYVGNFKSNLTVNGYRTATNQDIVIQIDGQDIRFDAAGQAALCPR
ncbi:MAG: DUF4360 domain-containing protein [Oligoflexales bacterium]|nr:DUF4360 domain-containing protein [Oligoflexales bacterium]